METSEQMRRLIAQFEGCRLTAYKDSVGVWTIGYGHTGADVHQGLTITQQRANELLASDLKRFERAVEKLGGDLAQHEFDAMVSFAVNLGEGALRSSTLLKKHAAGDRAGAREEFKRWNHAGGKVLAGLTKRRAAEAKVYGEGEYLIA